MFSKNYSGIQTVLYVPGMGQHLLKRQAERAAQEEAPSSDHWEELLGEPRAERHQNKQAQTYLSGTSSKKVMKLQPAGRRQGQIFRKQKCMSFLTC